MDYYSNPFIGLARGILCYPLRTEQQQHYLSLVNCSYNGVGLNYNYCYCNSFVAAKFSRWNSFCGGRNYPELSNKSILRLRVVNIHVKVLGWASIERSDW